MLTEVMRHCAWRDRRSTSFFETEHHAQVARDLRVAIQGGRLIALTAVTDEASDDACRQAAKLKTPLQIGRQLVRAFEAGFEAG